MHQLYLSYEYPDFLNSDGDFVEFDSSHYYSSSSNASLPSFRQLEESLDSPNPPTRNAPNPPSGAGGGIMH